MHILQVVPAVIETGRGVEGKLPVTGGGAIVNRQYAMVDDQAREYRHVAARVGANEPPTIPATFKTLAGASTMRVVPYTVTGNRTTNDLKVFPRGFFECTAGHDYYLLQKMVDGMPRDIFRFNEVEVGDSIEEAVMGEVRRKTT